MSRQAVLASKHAADITSPHSPSHFKLPPSSHPVRKTRSPPGTPITTKTSSRLTEETLQEFNRRNAFMEARYNRSSPYYKGLTDFSLDINRERLSGLNPVKEMNAASLISPYYKGLIDYSLVINKEKLSGSSPGRESQAESSISSFAVKVHEWGSSCFALKKHEKGSSSSDKSYNDNRASKTKKKIRYKEPEGKSEDAFASQKPLMERDSESLPNPLPQITPPTAPLAVQNPVQWTPSARVSYKNEGMNTSGNGQFVWADKYRPLRLQDFLCNRKAALELEALVRNSHEECEDCGHFIFEGNPGVGKRTMIRALLRDAFGPDRVQAREESKEFYLKGEAVASIHVNLVASPQHTEVNFSELKGYAKHVIFQLISEKNQKLSDNLNCNLEKCRVIILHEADKLSTDALSYVKWMLEKFKGCKMFFCCSDASKLEPIKPLCRFIQLFEPTNEEILKVLTSIASNEGIELHQQLANKIIENSRHNLRQAIRSFEATWNFNCRYSLKGVELIRTGWEETIANIARNAVKEQSPKQLYRIRQELQVLIEHNVAPISIFQTLTEELKIVLPPQLLPQFDTLYTDYKGNHAMGNYLASTHQLDESEKKGLHDPRKNVQEFMRIEEFMARFMSWYKASV